MDKKNCRVCGCQEMVEFIDFGRMPVANAFLKKEDLNKEEFFYEMAVGFCENCKMVQLINIVPYDKYIVPDSSGKTHYAFFSSTSKFMEKHFKELASEVEERFLNGEDKVLEIGSNDGIMLKSFKHKILGIEPSHNVADVAISKGVETLKEYFSGDLANKIVSERGKFKSILSTNVFLNIIDISDAVRGIRELLDDKGVFITEDPYIVDILDKNSYDQIYDEHIWYFSLMSLSNLFEMHGLEIFDCEHQKVHGGSMRVYVCKKGDYKKTNRLKECLGKEKEKGIGSLDTYLNFKENVERNKIKLKELLNDLKNKGKKIVGYAAASKGTIVQNYCDVGVDILDYISDSTPIKQGKFSPGKHIPIVSPDVFSNDNADYAFLGAWNHAEEIIKKESDFIERGGRFIVHLPEPRVIGDKDIEIKKLNVFANDQGYLFETLRTDDSIYGGNFGQVLVSVLYPGVIKGLHMHKKQTDYTTCVKGNIKYVAVIEKNGDYEVKTCIIGESNPILVKTPPGVWHGYTPLAGKEAVILHTMDKTYNPGDDDTFRKSPFEFGDVWSARND